jgi:hypothetical protein
VLRLGAGDFVQLVEEDHAGLLDALDGGGVDLVLVHEFFGFLLKQDAPGFVTETFFVSRFVGSIFSNMDWNSMSISMPALPRTPTTVGRSSTAISMRRSSSAPVRS